MKSPMGTQKDYEAFVNAQVQLYAEHVRKAYGIPENFDRRIVEVADFRRANIFTDPPPDHATCGRITFYREQFRLFDGEPVQVWIRK